MQQVYDEYWHHHQQGAFFRHKIALKLINKESQPVLDIGCGDGFFLGLLREKDVEAIGIDSSKIAIKKSKEKKLNVYFMSLEDKLKFPDNSFKTVIALDTFEHIVNLDLMIKEIYRICSDTLIVACPNFSNYKERFQLLFGKRSTLVKKSGHVQFINYNFLKNKLEKSGFKLQEEYLAGLFDHKITVTHPLVLALPNLFTSAFVFKCKKLANK